MGTIVIGHDNLIDGSAVALTHSTEVTGFEAENVQAPQPSQKFRSTVLNPGYVQADFGRPESFQLAAAIGHTGTPHWNGLRYGNDLKTGESSAVWAETNISSIAESGSAAAPPVAGIYPYFWTLAAATGVFQLEDTSLLRPEMTGTVAGSACVLSCYAKRGTGTTNLQLLIDDRASATVSVKFDLSDGSVNSNNDGGGFSHVSSGVVDVGSGWYRCWMSVTIGTTTDLRVRIAILDGSFATSWTATTETIHIAGAQLDDGVTAVRDPVQGATTAANAALFNFEAGTTTGVSTMSGPGYRSASMSADLPGPVSSYHLLSSAEAYRYAQVSIFDPNNAASQIDMGRVYIGPVLQPSEQTFVALRTGWSDTGLFRTWSIDLGQKITESEAFGDLADLARNLRVTSPSRLTETPGGQLIAPDGVKPVVIILDPDETDNPQEQMIYGFVVGLSVNRSSPVNVSGTITEMFSVQLEVWEAIA